MLSENIKRLRKEHGYSQQQIALKLHVTQGAVSQWENGITVPAADQLVALADAFGITVDDLLEREQIPETKDDAWEFRERIRRDPAYKLLFSFANKASSKNLRAAAAMLKALEPEEENAD